jgi:D-alanyl-D-alanine carboxypeptidase
MGAGILPIAYYKNNLYLLFSREFNKYKGHVDWRDFGGTPENNETDLQTAVREGWEESSGFLGNKKDIHNLIKNNLVTTVSNNKYKVYVVLVEYDSTLPKKFREHFLKMFNKDKTKIAKNGFYEKDMIKWLKVKDLKKNMWMFTSWYKIIVKKIYDKLK